LLVLGATPAATTAGAGCHARCHDRWCWVPRPLPRPLVLGATLRAPHPACCPPRLQQDKASWVVPDRPRAGGGQQQRSAFEVVARGDAAGRLVRSHQGAGGQLLVPK